MENLKERDSKKDSDDIGENFDEKINEGNADRSVPKQD